MASMDAGVLSAAVAGAGIYTAMLPPLAEVRRASTDSATARDVRTGLAMATAALVGTGAIIAMAEQDVKPLALTAALAGLMAAIYECTLRQAGEPTDTTSPGVSWHQR